VVWRHSLLLMNSFNKTEAAVLSCRLCFLRAFPFISFPFYACIHIEVIPFNINSEFFCTLCIKCGIKMCWENVDLNTCRAFLQCSAPKHRTFNPTFPQKQKLFSRNVKDLAMLSLLQETCKDKIKGLINGLSV